MKILDNLTPEQIATAANHLNGNANKGRINKLFKLQDESDKWPVCNRFNVTERAIRKVRREQSWLEGLEYALALDEEISNIVNGEV